MASIINYGKLQLKSLVTEGVVIDGLLFQDIAVYGADGYQYTAKDPVADLTALKYLNTSSDDTYPTDTLVYVTSEEQLYRLDKTLTTGIAPYYGTGFWEEVDASLPLFYICLDINNNLHIYTRYGTKFTLPTILKGIDFTVGFMVENLYYGALTDDLFYFIGVDAESKIHLYYFVYAFDSVEVFSDVYEVSLGLDTIKSFLKIGFFEVRKEMRNKILVSLNSDDTKTLYEATVTIVTSPLSVSFTIAELTYATDFTTVYPVGKFKDNSLPYFLCEIDTDKQIILKKTGTVLTNIFESYNDSVTCPAYVFERANETGDTGFIATVFAVNSTEATSYSVYGKMRNHSWVVLKTGTTTGSGYEAISITNSTKYEYYKIVVSSEVEDIICPLAYNSKNIFYERLTNYPVKDINTFKSISVKGFLSGESDYFVASDVYSYLFKVTESNIACVSRRGLYDIIDEQYYGVITDGFCDTPIFLTNATIRKEVTTAEYTE